MYDVVVIGAGPAGSQTARLLAEQGHRVLMLEEHPEVGIPIQCAGLITPRVFDYTPFGIGDLHENDLRGAVIVSPDGTRLHLASNFVQAQAMKRAGFDQAMAAAAEAVGVEIWTGAKATGMTRSATGAAVHVLRGGTTEEVSCRFIVGADGIRGNVAKWAGLPPVDEIVSAYEVELSGCRFPEGEDIIPMFAGKGSPGFFSWIIPVGGDRARAGVAVAPDMNEAAAKRYYEEMFTDPRSAKYLQGGAEVYKIIGGIPLGLRKRLVDDRVAVVGDAAGMAKPTSGGGIYMSLVAAGHLATVLDGALARDAVSRGDLLGYEKRVRKSIARELRKGDVLRWFYKRMRDDDFDQLAKLCRLPACRRIIQSMGDIDYPSRLVLPLLVAQPRLAFLFARLALRNA